jgi:hypothetical protein
MLHGSTTEHLFFQFKANFDKYNDYKFMCGLTTLRRKRRILIVTSSCSFSLAFYSMDTN